MSLSLTFRVPLPGWPRATFESDFAFEKSCVRLAGDTILRCASRQALELGVEGTLDSGDKLAARLVNVEGDPRVELCLVRRDAEPEPALREDTIMAPPSRSAWIHAVIALLGSAAGFVAGYLYLLKALAIDPANAQEAAWASKMAYHTAGWHLLLTLTLFPASVWGQRTGIRAVQFISLVFFCIHVGIAIANWSNPDSLHDASIAWLNAVSGMLFLASTIYGQRAHRDMDPVRALVDGRV